jgi:hypothetical protein
MELRSGTARDYDNETYDENQDNKMLTQDDHHEIWLVWKYPYDRIVVDMSCIITFDRSFVSAIHIITCRNLCVCVCVCVFLTVVDVFVVVSAAAVVIASCPFTTASFIAITMAATPRLGGNIAASESTYCA